MIIKVYSILEKETSYGRNRMHDVVFIPGAGLLETSGWPLIALDDPTLHQVGYWRGFNGHGRKDPKKYVLEHYAEWAWENLFTLIRRIDRPVDIYAHSMGFPLSLAMLKIADTVAPGSIRYIIGITPGVYHGEPKRNFHLTFEYAWSLMLPSSEMIKRTAAAIREIEKRIPHFKYQVTEYPQAMREAGDGVIHLADEFDVTRYRVYYAKDDLIIPADVTEHAAARADIRCIPIVDGYGHLVPLLDTTGKILELIRADNR